MYDRKKKNAQHGASGLVKMWRCWKLHTPCHTHFSLLTVPELIPVQNDWCGTEYCIYSAFDYNLKLLVAT